MLKFMNNNYICEIETMIYKYKIRKGYYGMEEEMRELYWRIRGVRRELGITQTELARKSGVSVVTISKIESGRFRGSIGLLERVCRELGIVVMVKGG
jgi:DNA-binding XRE family transcriptional regulator